MNLTRLNVSALCLLAALCAGGCGKLGEHDPEVRVATPMNGNIPRSYLDGAMIIHKFQKRGAEVTRDEAVFQVRAIIRGFIMLHGTQDYFRHNGADAQCNEYSDGYLFTMVRKGIATGAVLVVPKNSGVVLQSVR